MYSDEDLITLQSDRTNLVEWSKERQMLFNADKCQVMHVRYNNKKAKLECVSDEKRLGCHYKRGSKVGEAM